MNARMSRPWFRLAAALLSLGILALLAHQWIEARSARVESGSCGLEVLGFSTLSSDDGAEYCVLLPYGQRLEGQVWSDDQQVAILYVGMGDKQAVTSLYKGSAAIEVPGTTIWKRVDVAQHEVVVTDRDPAWVNAWLSPDGSRASVATCWMADSCQYAVIETDTGDIDCRFTVTHGWHRNGCPGVTQANGQYWDIKEALDQEACQEPSRLEPGIRERCATYAVPTPVVGYP